MNFRTLTTGDLVSIRNDHRYTVAQRNEVDREIQRRADQKRIADERADRLIREAARTGDITVRKLLNPVHEGDWHDKPLKWEVLGLGLERQLFTTKKEACLYRSIRRKSDTQQEAIRRYAATA